MTTIKEGQDPNRRCIRCRGYCWEDLPGLYCGTICQEEHAPQVLRALRFLESYEGPEGSEQRKLTAHCQECWSTEVQGQWWISRGPEGPTVLEPGGDSDWCENCASHTETILRPTPTAQSQPASREALDFWHCGGQS